MLRLFYATRNSWNGLVAAARTEKAVQQELWLLLVAIPLAFVTSWISLAIYVGVALIWLVPDRRIERVLDGE